MPRFPHRTDALAQALRQSRQVVEAALIEHVQGFLQGSL